MLFLFHISSNIILIQNISKVEKNHQCIRICLLILSLLLLYLDLLNFHEWTKRNQCNSRIFHHDFIHLCFPHHYYLKVFIVSILVIFPHYLYFIYIFSLSLIFIYCFQIFANFKLRYLNRLMILLPSRILNLSFLPFSYQSQ